MARKPAQFFDFLAMLSEYINKLATIVAYTPNGGHPRTALQNFMTISKVFMFGSVTVSKPFFSAVVI